MAKPGARAYVRIHRSRGRDIALSPTYFSENADIYADMVAGAGSNQVKKIMAALRSMQGICSFTILSKYTARRLKLNFAR